MVWVFLVIFSLSPVLYLLGSGEAVDPRAWFDAIIVIALMQGAFCIAQLCCSSKSLSYWDGLLAAAAATMTRRGVLSLIVLSQPVLLMTLSASFLLALVHDPNSADFHAGIRFGELILAIHKRRLYR